MRLSGLLPTMIIGAQIDPLRREGPCWLIVWSSEGVTRAFSALVLVVS